MQSSRDSSIWRSLAVAFGDGLAFGVGVKLAQGPQRPAAGAPPAEVLPFAERLEQIEQRLSGIEHAPAPTAPAAPAPAPFDQKVLEAVVNALDARLKEQAGQVERRLTELEAKIAIELKTLERQDHSIVTGLEARLTEVHGQYNEHVIAIRDAVAQDMDILYSQIAQLRQEFAAGSGDAMESRIAAAVASQVEQRIEGLEARLHDKMLEAVNRAALQVASGATVRLDEQLAPIHAALAEKDREIAEMRQRMADGDQTVLDLILAMGQMCRQVAERISAPAPAEAPVAETTPAEQPAAPPPSEPPPSAPSGPSMDIQAPPPDGDNNGHGSIEPIPFGVADAAVPETAQGQRSSRLWRIPLVSSFFLILAAGSLTLLR
jgi:hypothetical protein